MDASHPDQPKYETPDFPTGPLEAVKVEPELFVEEEHFVIPLPKTADSTTDEPRPKRVKTETKSTDDPDYIPGTQADKDDKFDDDNLLDEDLEDD